MQPSPGSQEVIKMIEAGLNQSSGKMNLSLPIYTLSADGVQIPISINYSGGGVKVDDVSTDIGLGWSLSAGGRITRVIRGNRPDEYPGLGYLDFKDNLPQSYPLSSNPDDLWDFVNDVYTPVDLSQADTEPDLFYFSVPGASGSFILKENGGTKLLTASQTKITWTKISSSEFASGVLEFEVVTPDGKIHIFGEGNEDYTEQQTFPAAGLSHVSDYSCMTPVLNFENEPAATTWHLSRLYQGFGADETVVFTYLDDSQPMEYQSSYSETLKTAERDYAWNGAHTTCDPISPAESVSGCITRVKHHEHHISEITSKNYKVSFSYFGTRPDLDGGGRRLDKIEIFHKDGNDLFPIRVFDFKTGIWTSSGSLTGTTANPSTKKRMFLDKVEIENGQGESLPGFDFHYANGNGLPPRLSFDQDYWGYYNGAGNSTLVPFPSSGMEGNIEFLELLTRHAPAERTPNEATTNYGTLTSYESPYGGTTSFEYENHKVDDIGTPLCKYEVKTSNISASYAYGGPDINTGSPFTIPFDQEVKVRVVVNQQNPSDFNPPGAYALLKRLTDWDITSPYQEIEKWSKAHNVAFPVTIDKEEVIFLSAGSYQVQAMVNFPDENVNIEVKYLTKTCMDEIVGGLRLKKKIVADVPISYEYKTTTNQPSGKLMAIPRFSHKTLRLCPIHYPPAGSAPGSLPKQTTMYQRDQYGSYSSRIMSKANGNHVEYKRVKEIYPSNGSIIRNFQVLADEPVGIAKTNFESAHAPKGDNSWQSGILMSMEYRDEADNLMKKEEYDYDFIHGNDDIVYGMTMKKEYDRDLFFNDYTSAASAMEYIDQYSIEYYPIRTDVAVMRQVTTQDFDSEGNVMTREATYDYDDKYRLERTTVFGSEGVDHITKFRYADDYVSEYEDTNSPAIVDGVYYGAITDPKVGVLRELVQRNHNSPIEQLGYIRKQGGQEYLTQASFLEYGHVQQGNQYLPVATHIKELETPILTGDPAVSFVTANGSLMLGGYTEQGRIDKYDYMGNPLQYTKSHHNPTSFIWDEQGLQVVAKVINGTSSHASYTSFEKDGDGSASANGGWIVVSSDGVSGIQSVWTDTDRKTGLRSLNLDANDYLKPQVTYDGTDYLLSFWYKGSAVDVYSDTQLITTATASTDWEYFSLEIQIPVPSSGDDDILYSIKLDGQASVLMDEVRLHPYDGLMETYCYHPETRKMTTSNSTNNIASHFRYDNFQRLEYAMDQDWNIVQNYEYIFHNEAGSGNRNQTWSRTVLKEGLGEDLIDGSNGTDFIDAFSLLTNDEKSVNVQYLDEYGRPDQEIAVAQSTVNGRDIVSFHKYDELGRENKRYLPFVNADNTGGYVLQPEIPQAAWYASNPDNTASDKKVAETAYPYSETVFEPSPLGRVLEQGAPGSDWQIGSGHTERARYRVIKSPSSVPPALRPVHIVHDFQSGNGGDYGAGELTYTSILDENSHKTISYKDKQGKVILIRKVGGYQYTKLEDTYNVYNDFGLLEAIIPPKAVELMNSSGIWDYTDASYENLVYLYEYDHRLRLKSKRIPGAGMTKYFYDARDQLVLTQDANQIAATQPLGSFTKYDKLGRPAQTGICEVSDLWTSVEDIIASAPSTYETHTENVENGYTNQAFPYISAKHHFLTHSFYGDYDFDNDGSPTVNYSQSQWTGIDIPQQNFVRLPGQLTATKVRIMDTDDWLTTATFYDDRMRVVQIKSEHHLGQWDVNNMEYDFSGKVVKTNQIHRIDNNGTVQTHVYREGFDYYDNGSLKNVRYKARYDAEYIRSRNVYNELGQLIERNLHANNAQGTSFLQSLDYRYNIRGWMESINDTYAPSSNQNVYSFIKGGQYIVSFSSNGNGTMDITMIKSIDCIPVGTNGYVPVDGTKTITVNSDLANINSFTIDLNGVTDITDLGSVAGAVSALEMEIGNKLAILGVNDNKAIAAPVYYNLKDMAKSVWYMIEDSHDEGENDLYSQRLYYNQGNSDLGSLAQFNGNISSTVWQVQGKDRQAYGYEYDWMDRLVKANYKTINSVNDYESDDMYSVPQITYDLNGNIETLERNELNPSNPAVPSILDNLIYTYETNSNRLVSVQDAGDVSKGFRDGSNYAVEYSYDANGNMTEDSNKGVKITYNHMNLPTNFIWENSSGTAIDKEIRILYDAAGVKLRKTIIDNTSPEPDVVKDYIGVIEYTDGDLEAVYHADGRCVPRSDYATYQLDAGELATTGIFMYEYTIRDHLGNARVSFVDWDRNGTVEVDHNDPSKTEILQEHHYYPFGMKLDVPATQVGQSNDYTYNGKEMNGDFGLDLHDYGARWYDASIGRFHTTDRFQEMYPDNTPYHYALNNPIAFIDMNGDSTVVPDESIFDVLPDGETMIPSNRDDRLPLIVVVAPDPNPSGDTSEDKQGHCDVCPPDDGCTNCGPRDESNVNIIIELDENADEEILVSPSGSGNTVNRNIISRRRELGAQMPSSASFAKVVSCYAKCAMSVTGAAIPVSFFGVWKSRAVVPYPRRGVGGNSSTGKTSEISEFFRKRIPGKFNKAKWAPTLKNPFSTTRSKGGFIGRWAGIFAAGTLLGEGILIQKCVDKCLENEGN